MDKWLKEKWVQTLGKRYPEFINYPIMEYAIDNLLKMYNSFKDKGLADSNFDSKLQSKEKYRYEQCMSELLFAHRLERDGFILSSKNAGPDFKAEKDGKVYWFEVITPEPTDDIANQNEDKSKKLHPDPDETTEYFDKCLLRITAAIKEKHEKFVKYLNSDEYEVSDKDALIIVINDSLLQPLDEPMFGLLIEILKGNSSLPLIAEALYGVESAYWVQKDSGHVLENLQRNVTHNHNNSEIPVDLFLNDSLSHISGVFCLTLREDYAFTPLCANWGEQTNRGVYIENLNANVKVGPSAINTQFYNYEMIEKIISRDSNRTAIAIETVQGAKLRFINNFNNLVELIAKNNT